MAYEHEKISLDFICYYIHYCWYNRSSGKDDFITFIDHPFLPTDPHDTIHNVYSKKVFKTTAISRAQSNRRKVGDLLGNIELSFDSNSIRSKKDSIIAYTRILEKNNSFPVITGIAGRVNNINVTSSQRESPDSLFSALKSIYISIQNDSINYKKLDTLLKKQLKAKQLNIDYRLKHIKGNGLFFHPGINTVDLNWSDQKDDALDNWSGVSSKSTYLREDEQFKVFFKDFSSEALKRSSTGIFLSLLLSLSIISCLFYLLKIINKQKELAEIKNDLISNITHEFKTPITTVSTALEAIETFKAIDDKEKTKKYLAISSTQLKKLHLMVEKLLETATLDSENLLLKREKTDVVELVKNASQKNEFSISNKNIIFHIIKEPIFIHIDPFHFENAISNLIDNAIKYGGDTIEVHINIVLNNLEISIADNGVEIEKNQREKIFDKFYRIPKGNTHDVKGFGIGLYYTKKIIEKHGGEIHLLPNSNNTIFKISLPI